MKLIVTIISSLWLCAQAFAGPGTYEGGGTDRTSVDNPSKYLAKQVVKALAPDVMELTETYQPTVATGTVKVFTVVSVFKFLGNGTVQITRNGTGVGSGYFYDMPEGRWVNYTYTTDVGPIHVSVFHNVKTGVVVRLGDRIGADGKFHYWTDQFQKTGN